MEIGASDFSMLVTLMISRVPTVTLIGAIGLPLTVIPTYKDTVHQQHSSVSVPAWRAKTFLRGTCERLSRTHSGESKLCAATKPHLLTDPPSG